MDLSDQFSIAIIAEASRKGATTGTCAGLYAMAIGTHDGSDAAYWKPLHDALVATFGRNGLERVKALAWTIYHNTALAIDAAQKRPNPKGRNNAL